jgi:small subunit ribosomal protein S2
MDLSPGVNLCHHLSPDQESVKGHMNNPIDLANLPDKAPEYDLAQMLEAGCHFGHQARKWHPKMKPFIYTEKDGVHIFDLAQTAAQLRAAYNALYELGRTGKTVVFIGTKRQARDSVKAAAELSSSPYITSRWLGGLLTNWEQIQKSLQRMNTIEQGLQNDAYKGYTKFERGQLEKELGRLSRFFSGLRNLKKKPDCLVIIDPIREKNAVKEAGVLGIPVIAMVDSNADPRQVEIAIPANDDAVTSIALIAAELGKAYQEGKKAA